MFRRNEMTKIAKHNDALSLIFLHLCFEKVSLCFENLSLCFENSKLETKIQKPCPCAITVPILRMFGAITVPNVLRRFGAKKVEMGCGVPVPKFGAVPV